MPFDFPFDKPVLSVALAESKGSGYAQGDRPSLGANSLLPFVLSPSSSSGQVPVHGVEIGLDTSYDEAVQEEWRYCLR